MKKILLNLSLILSSVLFCDELSWVDEQVEAIKPPRSGLQIKELSLIKDPFIFLKKSVDKDKKNVKSTVALKRTSIARPRKRKRQIHNKVLSIGAIMNNSVMINGGWYKVGDIMNGYRVSRLTFNTVLLIKNKKKLLLTTKSRSQTIKFLNK